MFLLSYCLFVEVLIKSVMECWCFIVLTVLFVVARDVEGSFGCFLSLGLPITHATLNARNDTLKYKIHQKAKELFQDLPVSRWSRTLQG